MDMNGYGTITAEAMSAITAPVKLWIQQGRHIKAFQHVSRSFNTLADRAANEAASTAAMLISSPSIQHIIIAAHAVPNNKVQLQLSLAVAHQALKLKCSKIREYEMCAALQIILLTLNLTFAHSGSSLSSGSAFMDETKQFLLSLAAHHKSLQQFDIICITFLSLPCIPASIISYLAKSAIPTDQCTILLHFLTTCSHASFFSTHLDNPQAQTSSERCFIVPTLGAKEPQRLVNDKVNDIEALLLTSTPRPLGLPLCAGEYDEFVWALLFGSIPGTLIATNALFLARALTAGLQCILPEGKKQSIVTIWGLLDKIQDLAASHVTDNVASPTFPLLAIFSKKIKLAMLGITEVFPIFRLPGALEASISLLAAQFKFCVDTNSAVECFRRVREKLKMPFVSSKSHSNLGSPQTVHLNKPSAEKVNIVRDNVSLTLHHFLKFIYSLVTLEATKFHLQIPFILGTTMVFSPLPELPLGNDLGSSTQCQQNINLIFNQLFLQIKDLLRGTQNDPASPSNPPPNELIPISNGIIHRDALKLLLVCDEQVWNAPPPSNNDQSHFSAAKSVEIFPI